MKPKGKKHNRKRSSKRKTGTRIDQARAKKHGEVYTPQSLVQEMIAKLDKSVWEENKTFCDPACGDGNFLEEVLIRKLKNKHNPLEALKTVYGCDIMQDSIRLCRMRLLKIVQQYEPITEAHIYAVFKNIIWLNTKKYPNGSLDYDFSFNSKKPKKEDVERWLSEVNSPAKVDPEPSYDVLEASDELADELIVEEENGVREGDIDWDLN